MSVTRTYTVTVVSTGSGNKYFIDGVQQATLNLAESGTYKFDVSDSTVGGHPFKFSSTTDAVAIIAFGGDKTASNGTFKIEFPAADASNAILRLA